MSRSLLASAATIALAAFVPQLPAAAQSGPSITVTSPITRSEQQPWTGVEPRYEVASHVTVYTDDLDLRTEYGRAVLDARIKLAADQACDTLDRIETAGVGAAMNPDSGDCRHLAAKNAVPQRRAAVILASR